MRVCKLPHVVMSNAFDITGEVSKAGQLAKKDHFNTVSMSGPLQTAGTNCPVLPTLKPDAQILLGIKGSGQRGLLELRLDDH